MNNSKHVSVQIIEDLYTNGNLDEKCVHIRKRENFKTPLSWISGRKATLYFYTNFINTQEKLKDTIILLSPKKKINSTHGISTWFNFEGCWHCA